MAQKDIRPSLVLNSEKKRKESKKDRIRKYDIAHLLEHCILLDRDFTRAESSRNHRVLCVPMVREKRPHGPPSDYSVLKSYTFDSLIMKRIL